MLTFKQLSLYIYFCSLLSIHLGVLGVAPSDLRSDQFLCRSGFFGATYPARAIDMTARCDGVDDCDEGSDEWKCCEYSSVAISSALSGISMVKKHAKL